MFSRIVDALRAVNDLILDWFESLLVVPILIAVLIIGLFASLPAVTSLVVGFAEAIRTGHPSKIDPGQLQVLLPPIIAFLTLTLLRHQTATRKAFATARTSIEGHVKAAIASVQGVEFLEFSSDLDLKRHLNRTTAEAKREVDDLTWAHAKPDASSRLPNRTRQEQLEWARLENEHSEIVRRVAKSRNYREIFVLSRADRIAKLRRRLSEKSPRYFCKLFRESPMPRLQFVIVDKTEVVFVSTNHRVLCSVKHPKLVRLFIDYFDDAWGMGLELVSVLDGQASWDEALTNAEIAIAEAELQRRKTSLSGAPVDKV